MLLGLVTLALSLGNLSSRGQVCNILTSFFVINPNPRLTRFMLKTRQTDLTVYSISQIKNIRNVIALSIDVDLQW